MKLLMEDYGEGIVTALIGMLFILCMYVGYSYVLV